MKRRLSSSDTNVSFPAPYPCFWNTVSYRLTIRSSCFETLIGGEAWSGTSGPLFNIVFVVGMLMLNWMLRTYRPVERWISGSGIVSALVSGGLAIAVLFTEISSSIAIPPIAPLAIQEIVLALRLILKGFDGVALDRLRKQLEDFPSITTKADLVGVSCL